MIVRTLICASGLAVSVFCTTFAASAANAEIPAADYPSHSQITFRPHVSNHDMDCEWGFLCEDPPLPVMHFQWQDELGRKSGMAQFAVTPHLRFALFGSNYGSGAQAKAASMDMRSAVANQGYQQVTAPVGCLAFKGWGAYAMACISGGIEVEARVGFYGATKSECADARRDLAKQTRVFLQSAHRI
jgi:hypothetical protein